MRIKVFVFAAVFLFAFVLVSCLNSNITEEPTAEKEMNLLNGYIANLASKGNNVDTTLLGVYYVKTVQGTGVYPVNGDTCIVGYAGYYLDGTLFDASWWHNQKDSTVSFVMGDPTMIKGWNDGLGVLNKNARAQIIIPSKLAYGSAGIGVIPPYQTLIFVVNMKEIKPSL